MAKQRAERAPLTFGRRLLNLGFASYDAYLASRLWAEAKRRYRDSGLPAACLGCDAAEVEFHHRTYVRLGREAPRDLIPLCRDCHRGVHDYEKAHHLKVEQTRKILAKVRGWDEETARARFRPFDCPDAAPSGSDTPKRRGKKKNRAARKARMAEAEAVRRAAEIEVDAIREAQEPGRAECRARSVTDIVAAPGMSVRHVAEARAEELRAVRQRQAEEMLARRRGEVIKPASEEDKMRAMRAGAEEEERLRAEEAAKKAKGRGKFVLGPGDRRRHLRDLLGR